jgi:hypothetical protein
MTRSDRQGPPWAIGFRSVLDERISARLDPHAGRLPAGLRGVFYRNGPGRHDLGGRRYRHWFDGDGLIHAFRFTDSGVAHHARFVETRKHAAERAAGRFLYAAFGTRFRGARLRADPEGLNTANTNVLPHHGRLLALWEGGAAHALDPDTLDTDGPVAWSDDTAGQPFSAHPRVEPDGTLWNFGVNPAEGTLILYEIAPDGRLRRARRIRLGATPMVHDFAVTERHLAFLLPPLHFRLHRLMAGASILGSYRWEPRHGLRALVIDKTDWDRQHWFSCPPASYSTSAAPGTMAPGCAWTTSATRTLAWSRTSPGGSWTARPADSSRRRPRSCTWTCTAAPPKSAPWPPAANSRPCTRAMSGAATATATRPARPARATTRSRTRSAAWTWRAAASRSTASARTRSPRSTSWSPGRTAAARATPGC